MTMLGRHVVERQLGGIRGRGLVATQDLPAGALVLVSPALAVSSASAMACALCFSGIQPEAGNGVGCQGRCGLVWCSEDCRSVHVQGYEPQEAPLLRAAPHDGVMCSALQRCGRDQDARLSLELLARCRRGCLWGEARTKSAHGQGDRAEATHVRFVLMAAAVLYSKCAGCSVVPKFVHWK